MFLSMKGTELWGVEVMCLLNVKFAFGQNVSDSFSNRIVGFIWGETCAQGRSTHLCEKAGQYTNFSTAFRRLAVKVLRNIRLIFFYFSHCTFEHYQIRSQHLRGWELPQVTSPRIWNIFTGICALWWEFIITKQYMGK